MIELYHCRGARSFRALWALEEVGEAYTLHILPFPPRTRAPGYLNINPLGTIPFMLIDGQSMSESSAIVEYLAGRFGRGSIDVAPESIEYPTYLNFLHLGESTLTFPQTIYLRYSALEPEQRKSVQVAEDYRRWFLSRLGVAVSNFKGDYACGQRFTAADISVGYAIKLAQAIGLGRDLPSAATTYMARIAERPAYRRALAAERAEKVSS